MAIDEIIISYLKDKHDSSPVRRKTSWSKFIEALSKPRKTKCLVADCKHHNCVHKNGAAWSPATYPPRVPRQKQYVEVVSLLVVDIDHKTDEDLDGAIELLAPYQYVLHASHSDRRGTATVCTCGSAEGALHGTECPRRVDRCVRAILAISRPVKRDEWPRFWRQATNMFASIDPKMADPACCDANRLYFLPSRPKDGDYYLRLNDGIALDVDAILAEAPVETPAIAASLGLDEDGIVEPGQRHAMLKSLAGGMRFRGCGFTEIESALLMANKARCNPPKSADEIRAIARWAADQPVSTLPGRHDGPTEDDHEDFARDKKGHPYNSPGNTELALKKLGVRLRYDAFSNEEIIDGLPGFGPRLDDPSMTNLWLTIEKHHHFLPTWQLFEKVVNNLARTNSFHPVRDYLDSIAWDNDPRIERWLIDYAGAPDTPYVRAVSRIVLVAAVRRIRHPGAKYDEMLILESEQGTDKSSGLRALAVNDEWFSDDLQFDKDTKHVIETTAGKWIVEAGELKGMRRSDVAALKACLSRQCDEARLAWGRKAHRALRQFVIIGTTNEFGGYLRDATGNRRFWPVRIKRFDLARLRADRDQLWAEAAVAEAANESIRLDPKLYGDAALEQEARLRDDDPLVDVLHRALGNRTGKLRVADAYLVAGIEPGRATQDQMDRFGRAIRELGWERLRRRFGGELAYAYVRGTSEQRDIELYVEFDPLARTVKVAPSAPSLGSELRPN
jgi:hypothetical protein